MIRCGAFSLVAVALLSAISCATCHTYNVQELTGPGDTRIELLHVECGDHRGLQASVAPRKGEAEPSVFFRLLFPREFADLDQAGLVKLEWQDSSTILVRYPARLSPAQRDSRVAGFAVEYAPY